MIVPHMERTLDRDRERTVLASLWARHAGTETITPDPETGHCSYWTTEDVVELVQSLDLDWELIDFQDTDDKIGNGFAIVLRKGALSASERRHIEAKWSAHLERRQVVAESFFRPGSPIGRAAELTGNAYRELLRGGPLGLLKRIKEFIRT
jgi:hypothetical protein